MASEAAADPLVSIEAAYKRFADVQALDGATLVLFGGECLGLLGPNGAGKSTLVRSVTGRVRLDAGDVRVHSPDAAAAHGIGVVPQEIALYPTLSARENLRIFSALRGLHGSQRQRRIEWALQASGLQERAEQRVETFSGGMQRRLNLVIALLDEPAVLLLDEPTVGVDPQSRERIWSILDGHRRAGAGLLLTTHQLDEAEEFCDRIAIIDEGRIIETGTVQEIIGRSIGTRTRVRLQLADPGTNNRWQSVEMDSPGRELAPLLDDLARRGETVLDIRLERPSLQRAFLSLTGKDLRNE
ncbi:MAG: ABC transporter ATP-binding protein [Gammaproteobacteria bacterium]|nr:ABC transporter ATP-binding protein [Gammaproteobacteria bacterium]